MSIILSAFSQFFKTVCPQCKERTEQLAPNPMIPGGKVCPDCQIDNMRQLDQQYDDFLSEQQDQRNAGAW
jgi:hypothetical protein